MNIVWLIRKIIYFVEKLKLLYMLLINQCFFKYLKYINIFSFFISKLFKYLNNNYFYYLKTIYIVKTIQLKLYSRIYIFKAIYIIKTIYITKIYNWNN